MGFNSGFKGLISALLKFQVFWDVTPRIGVNGFRRFELWKWRRHDLKGRKPLHQRHGITP